MYKTLKYTFDKTAKQNHHASALPLSNMK